MKYTISNDKIFYYRVLAPDGNFISSTNRKSVKGLLKNNKAVQILEDTIQLNFYPKKFKGPTELLINQCVVCGSKNNLTWHHILPKVFKRYYSKSHQMVLACDLCHQEYEQNYVDDFIKELCLEYGIINPIEEVEITKKLAIQSAKVLQKHKMHWHAYQTMLNNISDYLKIDVQNVRLEDLEEISKLDTKRTNNCREVYKKTENKLEIMDRWRQHFIDSMKPKYLPKFWDKFTKDKQ